MVLTSWTTLGEPWRSSSAAPRTSTGRAASSGVPAMNEPVTTTSSTTVGSAWAAADPAAPMARATAMTEPPQK